MREFERAEKGMIPAAPFVMTSGIGFISGMWGPFSVIIGLGEVLIGLHMYKGKKKYGSAILAGGILATFMGIGEVVWGIMSTTGNTNTASLEGWKKIMLPSAYGYEMLGKAFQPKLPTFTPTPQSAVQTGLRTMW